MQFIQFFLLFVQSTTTMSYIYNKTESYAAARKPCDAVVNFNVYS